MRFVATNLLCFLLMLLLCIRSSTAVATAIDETVELLEAAIVAENQDQNERSLQLIKKAEASWQQQEVFFGMVLRHDEIDNVTEEFARLKSYATTEDKDDFLSNCNALISRLKHIKEMEKTTLQNIM